MRKEYAEHLLKKTTKDYNLIAQNYDRSRRIIPLDVKELAGYARAGEKILDLGCASGRLFEVLPKVEYYGFDISKKLIEIGRQRYPKAHFKTGNALKLPFKDNFFDKIYSISVLHNIPSKEFRLQFLKEVFRVLKKEEFLILRVWDFWRRKKGWRLIFKYTLLKLVGKSKLDFFDLFVPWKNSRGQTVTERYFHCFTKRGLKKIIEKAGFKIIKVWRAGKDPRTNIYIIAQKPR